MTQTSRPTSDAMPALQQVQQLLEQQGRQWRKLVLIEGVCITCAAALGYFLMAVALDSLVRLPMFGRLVVALGLAGCLALVGRWQWRRWRQLQPDADRIALAVERNTPAGVQNRLINAVQIGRDPRYADDDLARLLVDLNWRDLSAMPLRQARILKPALLGAGSAGAVMLALAGLWALQPALFTSSAARILLPLAAIDPFYRTTLDIAPGDAEVRTGELKLTITLRGEPIDSLTILRNVDGRHTASVIPVPAGATQVTHTLTAIDRDFDYAVRGGDYTSRYFHVRAPRPVRIERLQATLELPAYVARPAVTKQTTGDLEALRGSRASLVFHLDQPVNSAKLITLDQAGAATELPLTLREGRLASAELTFSDQVEYHLQVQQPDFPNRATRAHTLRALPDQPPRVELAGLTDRKEVSLDEPLKLSLSGSDDYGLDQLEMVLRQEGPPSPSTQVAPAPWRVVRQWAGDNQTQLKQSLTLALMELEVAEADRVQLAGRALDRDPARAGEWSYSPIQSFIVGGLGVALQLTYEQILTTENELEKLVAAQQEVVTQCKHWLGQLRPESGRKWDEAQNIKELHAAAAELGRLQTERKQWAAGTARLMAEEAGTLRLQLGLLADTELERVVRIMDAIAERQQATSFTQAFNDALTTANRIVDSLRALQTQHHRFRRSWELAHMIPYVKMVADRQQALAEISTRQAEQAAAAPDMEKWQRGSSSRRQAKLSELRQLAQAALQALGVDGTDQPILREAFARAGEALNRSELKQAMDAASSQSQEGQWSAAAGSQAAAAVALLAIHADLRAAQTEAARQVMAALAGSDAQTQQQLDQLLAGSLEQLLSGDPNAIPMEEIIRMHKLAQDAKKKHESDTDDAGADGYQWDDSMLGLLYGKKPPPPDFNVLSLAEKPGGQRSFPESSDLQGNKIELALLEGQYQDLVGDLLEEADDMRDQFETYNLNAQGQGVEEGDIGKQAGDINSVSAAAPTGNQKPPTNNFGGASRSGRGGARAHGMVVGNESVNRRGRDQAQEGQERVADQAGELREVMSDDPMKDTSTGIGGKKVRSDDTAFSTKDAGKWTDDMLGRMDKPQQVQKIVERQDGSFSAEMAQQMRDLSSQQEQMIKRLKTLRKELKNLYLPTDHIDQAIAELSTNLDALKQTPDAEVFRRQVQSLDRLRATLRVFRPAGSDFQPSLPRQQQIRGRVVDDAPRPLSPDYDEAVKQYYETLTQP